MTSKERVRKAILHQQPDKVPANFECVASVHNELLKRYNFSTSEQLLQKFEIDIRAIGPEYAGPALKRYEEGGFMYQENFWGWKDKMHWAGKEFNSITSFYPLDSFETIEQLDAYRWPSPDWFNYESIKSQCEKFKDRAI